MNGKSIGQARCPFSPEIWHRPDRTIVLQLPGQNVPFLQGAITASQIAPQRPSYINALLIQSRGQLAVPARTACRGDPGLRPFPECRQLPGHFAGCCSNCKTYQNTGIVNIHNVFELSFGREADDYGYYRSLVKLATRKIE